MKIKCTNCGYDWEYKGQLDYTTCPNCQKKTKTKKMGDSNAGDTNIREEQQDIMVS